MSVVTNGTTQWLHRNSVPGATFSALIWARRDTDLGVSERVFCPKTGGSAGVRQATLSVSGSDVLQIGGPTAPGNMTGNPTFTVASWRLFLITYLGETNPGVSADGVLTIKTLVDGDSAFAAGNTTQRTAQSDVVSTDFVIAAITNAGSGPFAGTFANCKVWSGIVISDADALTEMEYRNVQTNGGSLWAHYKFLTGALGTDSSGNGRTLTQVATPTFSANEPTAILGDDPGGSFEPAWARNSNQIIQVAA
jgi:hypothetical protein